MKLEKREITLNEADSLTDVFYTQKNLATHYIHALECVQRKESKGVLLSLLKEVGEDLYASGALMREAEQCREEYNGGK